jgi:hypothetical protein
MCIPLNGSGFGRGERSEIKNILKFILQLEKSFILLHPLKRGTVKRKRSEG